jgi:hypothetical protein
VGRLSASQITVKWNKVLAFIFYFPFLVVFPFPSGAYNMWWADHCTVRNSSQGIEFILNSFLVNLFYLWGI